MLRRLGIRHVSPPLRHSKADLAAQEEFRWKFGESAANAAGQPGQVEIWFTHEAKAGQQGMLPRVWVGKATRLRIPRDRCFGQGYLFSAACPERECDVGHVCSRASTVEMNRHLADITGPRLGPEAMLSSSSTAQIGNGPRNSIFPPSSPCCIFHSAARNRTQWKASSST